MPADLDLIDGYLMRLSQVLQLLPRQPVLEIIQLLRSARDEKRGVFIFGNGGSAATSSHMVCDLVKNAHTVGGRPVRAQSLNDNFPTFSAYANDEGYEQVFSQPLEALAEAGDLAIAISGSGNSPNVLKGIERARQKGLTTIGLTGFAGGKLKDLVDVCLVVPSEEMEQIEDLHMVVDHLLTLVLRSDGSVEAKQKDI
jgi:D-sedoheptulose 7-phosphate isomerase